jgi:hypothetical protein
MLDGGEEGVGGVGAIRRRAGRCAVDADGVVDAFHHIAQVRRDRHIWNGDIARLRAVEAVKLLAQ